MSRGRGENLERKEALQMREDQAVLLSTGGEDHIRKKGDAGESMRGGDLVTFRSTNHFAVEKKEAVQEGWRPRRRQIAKRTPPDNKSARRKTGELTKGGGKNRKEVERRMVSEAVGVWGGLRRVRARGRPGGYPYHPLRGSCQIGRDRAKKEETRGLAKDAVSGKR